MFKATCEGFGNEKLFCFAPGQEGREKSGENEWSNGILAVLGILHMYCEMKSVSRGDIIAIERLTQPTVLTASIRSRRTCVSERPADGLYG